MAPGLEPSISVVFTRRLVEAAVREGIDPKPLEQLLGSVYGDAGVATRIPVSAHCAAWSHIMRALREPGFPVRLAGTVSVDDYEILGMACKTAATLGDALSLTQRYLSIWTDLYRLRILPFGNSSRIAVDLDGERDLAQRVCIESSVAEIFKAVQDVTDGQCPAISVHFAHVSPPDVVEHTAFFGIAPVFDSSFDGFEVDSTWLRRPLSQSDGAISSYFETQLEAQTRQLPRSRDQLEERTRQAIVDALPGGPPRIGTIATALAMSSRTLQRRLEERGLTYKKLLEDTRCDLAPRLLESPDRKVSDVARLLGFSDSSSFHRAFKRWTGHTPASFRDHGDTVTEA